MGGTSDEVGAGTGAVGGGMVVMMPGRLLALWLTEKVLWGAPLTPVQMTAVFVVIEVPANLLFWLLCTRLIRFLRRRLPEIPA